MKLKFTLFIFISAFLLLLNSCKNNSEEQLIPEEIIKPNNSIYGNVDFKFPELSENAKAEISHWGAFGDFDAEVKTINGNTIDEIKNKTKLLVSHIDSLTKKIPDTLYTSSIYSRVMVVKTRTSLLKQEVSKGHIDSIKIQEYFDEMNISVKNLYSQINEKFQKDAIDLQRIDNEKQELEDQKRFLDSVYKAELQDQKK